MIVPRPTLLGQGVCQKKEKQHLPGGAIERTGGADGAGFGGSGFFSGFFSGAGGGLEAASAFLDSGLGSGFPSGSVVCLGSSVAGLASA